MRAVRGTVLLVATILALVATLLVPAGTGTADASTGGEVFPRAGRSFQHVATFDVIAGNGSAVAEIVDSTPDGNTLVYADADSEAIGFVDISVPSSPVGLGTLDMGGEPTSLVVRGDTVLVAVNTSTSFVEPSGVLKVVDIASRTIAAELPLPGQPDSTAISDNERILAVVIENERDEDLNNGFLPQLPTGGVTFFDMRRSDPNRWRTYEADLRPVARNAPDGTDLEPEYVDILHGRAVVTFQENNYIAVINIWTGRVLNHFSAGSVFLRNVDSVEERLITLDSNLNKRREPDAAAWINPSVFATANEGDYEDPSGEEGGARGFTIFNRWGGVLYESGESYEHVIVSAGQYNEDRSENKGVEPESVEYGNFGGDQFLFVGAERSNAIGVYDVRNPRQPEFVQLLPTGIRPEGLKAIPDRNLLIASTEADEADAGIPTMINIYELADEEPAYPMIYSANDAAGLPIPWLALSGMVADPVDPNTLYAVSDAFLASGFIYTIDVTQMPAVITDRLEVTGASADLDLEGIAVGPDGSFWLGSEGDAATRPNLVLKVDPATGAVLAEVELPAGLADQARSNGIEGIAVTGEAGAEVVYVVIQRAWPDAGDTDKVNTKIGRFDTATDTWGFVHYPLQPEGGGGWIGLSELTLLPDGDLAVIERDKGWGPTTGLNAELKAVYEVDLDSAWFRAFDDPAGLVTIEKNLLADLVPDVAEASIWTAEKVEGLAVTADQRIFVVTDNDGVDGATGETIFLELDFDLNLEFPLEATIPEIQGAGHRSPFAGQEVTTTGVVTAVLFNGYYMQDPDGDGDDATSDGIFVFTGSAGPKPEVGYEVEVAGTVSEFIPGGAATGNLSVTQLSGPFSVLSAGNPLPEPVEIGIRGRIPPSEIVISDSELPTNLQDVPGVYNPETDAIDFYESLEGMYVQVDRPQASSAVREFNQFSAEFFALPSNGRTATDRSHLTQRGGILLQPHPDNRGDQNPERIQIQFDSNVYPGPIPAVTVGDGFEDVNGVVGYSFGNYEVIATTELQYRNPSVNQPEFTSLAPTNNRVTVATYNVLNLSPGPEDDAQRAKLAGQIANNLQRPDVIALQEVQDNSGEVDDGTTDASLTLQALVDAIVTAGGPQYEFFDVAPADGSLGGVPGGNIRNAFLYNPARVQLLDSASLDPDVLALVGAPNPQAFDGSRSPLAGLFSFEGTPFTVVNVHNTSRFGSTPIFGGPQPFAQAGEQAREDQAAALNAFVDFIVAGQSDAIVMVAGDFNTFEWTNDLAEILPGPDQVLTNLITGAALRGQDERDRYTFIFEGNSQALDHFFVTQNVAAQPETKLDIVHVNVDFPSRLTDVVASDHEPLVGRFRLPASQGPLELPGGGGDAAFTLQVLHASDLEGGVDALDRATNFAAIVDALEDDTEVDGSVTISAGDNYIPGPFFGASGDASLRPIFQSVYQQLFGEPTLTNIREGGGRGDITIMNIIGFDASAIGNHEFDAGSDTLASIIAAEVRPGDIRWTGADFPYLSANLDFTLDTSLNPLFTGDLLENTAFAPTPAELLVSPTPKKIAPSTFITVANGERIGVVGATTDLLESISSPGDTSVIGPLAGLVQAEIDALEAAGINKIIVTSHLQQLALEEALAAQLTGVDIIIAGGSDSLLANPDDVLRAGDFADREYPVAATSADGEPVAIVSTDGEYSYVGRLVVEFDEDGVLLPLDELDLTVNGPIKTEIPEVEALWGSFAAATAPGTKGALVQAVVDGIQGVIIAKDGNVIGATAVYLEGRRSQVRTEETNLGDLTADANLAVAQAFDPTVVLSIKNGGGIRASIGVIDSVGNLLPPPANPATGKLEGQISQLDIENSLRFNNGLTLLTLTSPQLLAVFEHAVAATTLGATPGQFAQIGGARFEYNPAMPAGSRIVSITLDDGAGTVTPVYADGVLVDPAATYRIVTLNFLAAGGDSYPFPIDSAANRIDLTGQGLDPGASTFAAPGSEQDALAEYLIANHSAFGGSPYAQAETPPAADTRIVDVTVAGGPQ